MLHSLLSSSDKTTTYSKSSSSWAHLHPRLPILPLGPRGNFRFWSSPHLGVWEALSVLRGSVCIWSSSMGGCGPSVWILVSAQQVWLVDTIFASVSTCFWALQQRVDASRPSTCPAHVNCCATAWLMHHTLFPYPGCSRSLGAAFVCEEGERPLLPALPKPCQPLSRGLLAVPSCLDAGRPSHVTIPCSAAEHIFPRANHLSN